jgi:K+-sensing histidine kinase KdpD
MLNDILDVSKMNSGVSGAQQAFRPTRPGDSRNKNAARQGGPGEDVSCPLPPQPYIAVSDCDLIERIIANMISNAVKFTSSGAVQPFICPVETS